jgi:hypothetical protein
LSSNTPSKTSQDKPKQDKTRTCQVAVCCVQAKTKFLVTHKTTLST